MNRSLEAFRTPSASDGSFVFAPNGAGIGRMALVRDAVLGDRFTVDDKAAPIDPDASSVDPMNGVVASNVTPVAPMVDSSKEPETPKCPWSTRAPKKK